MFTLILLGICFIVWVIASIIATVYIKNDAPKNNEDPTLWIVLTVLLTHTGFAIYKFKTGHSGQGLFYLIIPPTIIFVLFFFSTMFDFMEMMP